LAVTLVAWSQARRRCKGFEQKMKNASMVFEIFDFQKAERKKMQIDTKMPCPSGKKRLASPILH
jgi:hypothetical protein